MASQKEAITPCRVKGPKECPYMTQALNAQTLDPSPSNPVSHGKALKKSTLSGSFGSEPKA